MQEFLAYAQVRFLLALSVCLLYYASIDNLTVKANSKSSSVTGSLHTLNQNLPYSLVQVRASFST